MILTFQITIFKLLELPSVIRFVVDFSRRLCRWSFAYPVAHSLPRQTGYLAEVDLALLIAHDIQGVILDLDNTIVSEDDRYLSPNSETWIERAKHAGLKLFILSNGKRLYRLNYWSARLRIPAIHRAQKPFPMAFRKALIHMQLQPNQIVVIGDSRHTDIVGAWLMGCSSIQVATLPHPYHWWEKLLGKYIQTSYPINYEIWKCHLHDHR